MIVLGSDGLPVGRRKNNYMNIDGVNDHFQNNIDMNKKELEERIKGLEHVIRVYKEEDIEISVDIYERLDQYQGELLKAQGEEKSGKISKANGNK